MEIPWSGFLVLGAVNGCEWIEWQTKTFFFSIESFQLGLWNIFWIVVVSLWEFEWLDSIMLRCFFSPKVSCLFQTEWTRLMLQLSCNTEVIFLLQLSIPWSTIEQIENGRFVRCSWFLCFVSSTIEAPRRRFLEEGDCLWHRPVQRAGFSRLGFFRYFKRGLSECPLIEAACKSEVLDHEGDTQEADLSPGGPAAPAAAENAEQKSPPATAPTESSAISVTPRVTAPPAARSPTAPSASASPTSRSPPAPPAARSPTAPSASASPTSRSPPAPPAARSPTAPSASASPTARSQPAPPTTASSPTAPPATRSPTAPSASASPTARSQPAPPTTASSPTAPPAARSPTAPSARASPTPRSPPAPAATAPSPPAARSPTAPAGARSRTASPAASKAEGIAPVVSASTRAGATSSGSQSARAAASAAPAASASTSGLRRLWGKQAPPAGAEKGIRLREVCERIFDDHSLCATLNSTLKSSNDLIHSVLKGSSCWHMDTAGYQGPQTPKRPKRKSAPPKRPELCVGMWCLNSSQHGGFGGKHLGCLHSIMRLRDLLPEIEFKIHHDSLRMIATSFLQLQIWSMRIDTLRRVQTLYYILKLHEITINYYYMISLNLQQQV